MRETVPSTSSDETPTPNIRAKPLREAFFVWCLMVLIAGASFGLIYQRAKTLNEQTIDVELTRLAAIAASLINADKHKELTDPAQTDSALYQELLAPLVKYHRAAPSLYYVYTVIEKDGDVRFILDTAKYVRDIRPTVALSPSRVMDAYNKPDPQLRQTLEQSKISVGNLFQDQFGTFKSGFAPFFDSQRELVGAVGIDISADAYIKRIDEVLKVCSYGLFGSLLLASLIAFFIYRIRCNVLKRETLFENERTASAKELKEKNLENERLLANILPHAIALRLKAGEELIADTHERVTVVFVDLSGFTLYSAGQPARRVVDTLNRIFSMMDELAVKYRLEKIKTIGDAYMVVGGLDPLDDEHLNRVADMTLEMVDSFEHIKETLKAANFNIRVGIATGPVVAGVIGSVKFAYDLWGDTVNTASRMESHSIPARIHCTEDFYRYLADEYAFEDRGDIDVKGKGIMHTYFLLHKKTNH